MGWEEEPDEHNPYQPPEAGEPAEEAAGSASGAVIARFMRLLGEDGSVITQIWVLIALFNLGIIAVSAAVQYRLGVVPFSLDMLGDPTAMESYAQQQRFSVVSLVIYPLTWISCGLYYAGFRPMRLIESGHGEDMDLARARQAMFSNFGSILGVVFLYLVAVFLGTACCVAPGLIAAVVLMPAPYLVAARRAGVFSSLSTSIDWIARHWLLLAGAGLVLTLLSVAVMLLAFMVPPTLHAQFGAVGIFAGNGILWLLGSIMGYFAWVLVGSILITIDLAEERYFEGSITSGSIA
jgi:hypothetical protein